MKKYYKKKTKELDDERIAHDLRQFADDYANGAIVEVRDALLDIVEAIDDFCDDQNILKKG